MKKVMRKRELAEVVSTLVAFFATSLPFIQVFIWIKFGSNCEWNKNTVTLVRKEKGKGRKKGRKEGYLHKILR